MVPLFDLLDGDMVFLGDGGEGFPGFDFMVNDFWGGGSVCLHFLRGVGLVGIGGLQGVTGYRFPNRDGGGFPVGLDHSGAVLFIALEDASRPRVGAGIPVARGLV